MDTTLHRFAKRLHKLRVDQGLTQEALAARSHLHASYISALERAQKVPGLMVLESLAKALNVDIALLVTFGPATKVKSDRVAEELILIQRLLQNRDLSTIEKARKQIEVLVK